MEILILIGIFLLIRATRRGAAIPDYWLEPADEYYYIFAAELPFENDVMKWKEMIMRWGEQYGIEAAVIAGVIAKESQGRNAWNPDSRYVGLMQFGTSEARAMGYTGDKRGLLDPDTNIHWGSAYLSYWMKHRDVKGYIPSAIAGYNLGKVSFVSGNYANQGYVDAVVSCVPRFRFLLAKAYPGYARVFPKSTWLKTESIYA